MLHDVLKVCVPAVFGEGWRCCHQLVCGRLWNVYMFKGSLGVKSPTLWTDEFSVCSTQCAHGLVKTWVSGWCAEWAVPIVICCWWCETWIEFPFVLHNVRMVLLRFGDVSGCAEWAVPIVICCWWCEFWRWREIRFFCVPAVMAWVLGRWREIRPPPSSCQWLVRIRFIRHRCVLTPTGICYKSTFDA